MAWTITLIDENHCQQAQLDRELTVDIDPYRNEFLLLRYLDLYGDTVFNCLQMEDLIKDLLRLKISSEDSLIDAIIALQNGANKKCIFTWFSAATSAYGSA
jgi:hypothetical protein